MAVFADLWRGYGGPQRMKIHISKTGEEITLIDGLPVTDNAKKCFIHEDFQGAKMANRAYPTCHR